MSTNLTDAQRAQLAADYPHTRNGTLATRYGLTVQQVRAIADSEGLTKDAYLAQGAYATPRLPADRIPRYPSPFYCERCGWSNSHAPGCTATNRDGRKVAPAARIRRNDERVAA